MGVNGLRLGEGGYFTTELHTEHTLQIYEKLSYEALNRHFCQTAVISWPSVLRGCEVAVRCGFCCRVKMLSAVR